MLAVHHAPDAEDLVAALAVILAHPLGDPLAREQVAVHSRGLERWVAQRLSHVLGAGAGDGDGDGICAAVDFPFPGRLVQRALVGSSIGLPEDDPWQVDRLAWHLLALLTDDPALARGTPLERHLAETMDGLDGGPSSRRFGAVRRVADLFDRYGVHRPRMLRRWCEGGAASPVFADGAPLPPTHAWQASLWRTVRDHLLASTGVPSPPERMATAVAQLAADPEVADLPSRVALFGLTALPSSYLEVLRALGIHREVHLFLLHPSPGAWRRLLPTLAELPAGAPPLRAADPTASLPANPLLRTWGRDAREMQVVLAAAGIDLPDSAVPSVRRDVEVAAQGTLLARLQADVRDDAVPAGLPPDGGLDLRLELTTEDRSVEVHGCHGPARQAEVLRDRLLHRFAQDPTLEPRDVLVLCPDVDAFAPLLEAAFGGSDPELLSADQLRLRITDRSLLGANPLLRLLGDLLELVDGRAAASEVRDLLGRAPVRNAFGFDDGELERIGGWVEQVGVRWGVDEDDRDRHGVPTDVGTWARALDRLLVGASVADEGLHTVGDVVPFDDVTSGDLDLLGRVAEFVTRLDRALQLLRGPRPMAAWRDAIRTALADLTVTDDASRWQRIQVDRLLDDLARAAATVPPGGGGAADVTVGLGELRSLLRDRMAGAGATASHRTGDLTVATLVPMRSVPHRVVALLGMDDGAIPRSRRADGDDLLELDPHVGDRDPRTEDRQLLLDALLAAREQLLVLNTSRDPRSNEVRPPALPVAELLDVIDRTARGPVRDDGTPLPASEVCTTQHPLHGSDPRNFTPGALGLPGRAFGTDPVELAGARAAAGTRTAPAPFLREPLAPAPREPVIELDALIRTVVAPRGTFLDARFGLRFDRDEAAGSDELPLELRGLGEWIVGENLLSATLDGADPRRALDLERARGALPPGELGVPGARDVLACLEHVHDALSGHGLLGTPEEPHQIDVTLGHDRRLVGAIDEVVGSTVRHVGYSRLKERDRLGAWIRVLALSVADPTTAWRAVTVGRAPTSAPKGAVVSVSVLGPIASDPTSRLDEARRELAWLVELHDRALDEPLPVAPLTSCRFATSIRAVADPTSKVRSRTSAAAAVWNPGTYGASEGADPVNQLVQGGAVPFQDLLSEAPRDDEGDTPWDVSEPSRFGRWALRLWSPLLDAESLEHRP